MPELPEVEIIVSGLKKVIVGKTINDIYINAPKIDNDNRKGWLRKLRHISFLDIRRRGKNILIDLSNNHTLWIHLKMTGHLYYWPKSAAIEKHDLVIFSLSDSSYDLRFNDYRRFGRIRLFKTGEIMNQKGLAELGPEPLKISAPEFCELITARKRMIKPALLDQSLLAGLGNIYCDESLFLSRIHPRKSTHRISQRKLVTLHRSIRKILRKAIRCMGTTVDSFAGINGEPGGFQKYLLVYGHEGEPCPRCGATIKREKIGSRSAHYCPRCQRLL